MCLFGRVEKLGGYYVQNFSLGARVCGLFLCWLMVPVCKHALGAACIAKAKIIEYHMIYVAPRTIQLGYANNWSNCMCMSWSALYGRIF